MVRFSKFFRVVFLSICCVFCFSISSFAYSFPPNTYYVRVNSTLGDVTIVFPDDQAHYIKWSDDNNIINCSNGYIYGYANRRGESWRIRFYSFNIEDAEAQQWINGRYTDKQPFYADSLIESNLYNVVHRDVPNIISIDKMLPFVFCILLMIIIYYLKGR